MADIFVPENFEVPLEAAGAGFIIRKLTVDEVEKDYKAVMSSKESLRKIFPDNHDGWPADTMTLEDNYNDLKEHQDEFDKRIGFAYTVVNSEDTECIGCIYLFPWEEPDYDCQLYFWVTDKVKNRGFEQTLETFIKKWIDEAWPFKNVVYPGRSISMEELFGEE